MVVWQSIDTYPGGKALFWIEDRAGEYAVFGELDRRDICAADGGALRVWDDNDFGYAEAQYVTHWAECAPPVSPHLH